LAAEKKKNSRRSREEGKGKKKGKGPLRHVLLTLLPRRSQKEGEERNDSDKHKKAGEKREKEGESIPVVFVFPLCLIEDFKGRGKRGNMIEHTDKRAKGKGGIWSLERGSVSFT